MDSFDDGGFDGGRNELALPGEAAEPPAWRRWRTPAVVALAAVAAAAGVAWLGRTPAPEPVALAVPASALPPARLALQRASVAFEVRDGALWVAPADVARAIEAVSARAETNAVADALGDESIFSSAESLRARRTAATIRMLESSIAMQPGVARASVVVGEPGRTPGLGTAPTGTASVTVAMRGGPMPQDLVDAVAMLVSGACPGVRPESVVIVDAGEGRVRAVRPAHERASAEATHDRERRTEALVAALVSDLPGATVDVRDAGHGAMVTTVRLPQSLAAERAGIEADGDLGAWLESERARIADRIDPFVLPEAGAACGGAVVLAIVPEAGPERSEAAAPAGEDRTAPAASLSTAAPVRTLREAEARERATPLGTMPTPGTSSFPAAFVVAGLAAVGIAAWWAWQRTAARRTPAAEDVPASPIEEDHVHGVDASEAVRDAVGASAAIVRSWLDAGRADRAARLVVALDAPAATALLQALPVACVQRVTAALGSLDAPTHAELSDAVRAFLDEHVMAVQVHPDVQEAA
jgi:type III secretory pathway lipoprotein EscJ